MISSNKFKILINTKKNTLLLVYFFFNFLNTFTFFNKNQKALYLFWKFSLINKNFFLKSKKNSNISFFHTQNFKIYENSKEVEFFQNFKIKSLSPLFELVLRKTSHTRSKLKNFSFIKLFFSFSSFKSPFSFNHDFRFFFIHNTNEGAFVINTKVYFKRWIDAQIFFFNIYYYNFSPLLFGSNDFKYETLSINWSYLKLNLTIWNQISPFFIYKTPVYNLKTNFFFTKLKAVGSHFYVVSNPNYHFKTLHYLKKQQFFTLGPVSSNLSPWLLSYPIPVFTLNRLVEYYFIKFIIFYEKNAFFYKYNFFKSYWSLLSRY